MCLQGPGAYLEYDGFRRDTGRDDQISRKRPMTAMARRRLFILHSLPRRFSAAVSQHTARLALALDDAHYFMARCLVESSHRRWARRYAWRCLRRRYKFGRSLALMLRSVVGR
jgi:hypothetical protein